MTRAIEGHAYEPPLIRLRLTCIMYDMTANILQSSMTLSTPASLVYALALPSSLSLTSIYIQICYILIYLAGFSFACRNLLTTLPDELDPER